MKAFRSVDRYIAAQPRALQGVLERVRSTIRKAVPGGEEVISYGIPAYKRRGHPMLYFAGWKQHYSIYPSNDRIVAAFREQLKGYSLSKGTIRFPLDEPVPVRLIAGIARLRAKQVDEREKARAARPRKR
jgi:uncharacterized protein YdhG (YjbR/CyaY superfamily)